MQLFAGYYGWNQAKFYYSASQIKAKAGNGYNHYGIPGGKHCRSCKKEKLKKEIEKSYSLSRSGSLRNIIRNILCCFYQNHFCAFTSFPAGP